MSPQIQVDAAPVQVENAREVEAAYNVCRLIAKREAKNFYYSFVALPRHKRDAICSIYAFMRKADDLSDDESVAIPGRRSCLNRWIADWQSASDGKPTADPVFIAVRDAVARFQIPLSLLDELVAGVTMDLNRVDDDHPDTYATFTDLYRYCYLVASVVGLVCIRIFGYSDPRAEKLAEETGIAFQLTNILRDVAEDAERNRVYLPLDRLYAHGIKLNALLHRAKDAPLDIQERALLREMAERAEEYYKSSQQLMPLIDKDSRPALWVLVSIYHELLKRIERADYDVFSARASVPSFKKLAILGVGIARMAKVRVAG